MVNLIKTETEQDNAKVAELAAWYADDETGPDAIVVVDNGDGTMDIVDGHHRFVAAESVNVAPRVHAIARQAWADLMDAGHDPMVVAAAVHDAVGDTQALNNMASQWRGNLIDDAMALAKTIRANCYKVVM